MRFLLIWVVFGIYWEDGVDGSEAWLGIWEDCLKLCLLPQSEEVSERKEEELAERE